MHMTREKFNAGAINRKNWLERLRKDAAKVQALGITEQILCCFMTDAYNDNNTSLTRPSLQILQEYGMAFCVLTKGGKRSLADIDLFRPDRDCYAATLTCLDDAFSKRWESRAALPADRIATLKKFHDKGIFTWVSLEPTLSPEASLAIVEETHKFVDLYKIGKANYLGEYAKAIDWQDYTMKMITKCVKLGAKHYIKENLQKYLPDGYYNPLRVKQHHGDLL
jgi:DNA repair photolyase